MVAIAAAALGILAMQQNPATTPTSKMNEQWWSDRHKHCVELTKQDNFDVLFLGDSITQGWEGSGKSVWDEQIAPLKAANFGFSGDRTEHVLWRLDNGEIMGMHAKLIVVMIGTNNIGQHSTNADQTDAGVRAIIAKLRQGVPNAKILLLGIFPRGLTPNDPMRVQVADATAKFKSLDDNKHVFFMDIGRWFVRPDGMLRVGAMPDQLHPNKPGYEIWAKATLPRMKELLGMK